MASKKSTAKTDSAFLNAIAAKKAAKTATKPAAKKVPAKKASVKKTDLPILPSTLVVAAPDGINHIKLNFGMMNVPSTFGGEVISGPEIRGGNLEFRLIIRNADQSPCRDRIKILKIANDIASTYGLTIDKVAFLAKYFPKKK